MSTESHRPRDTGCRVVVRLGDSIYCGQCGTRFESAAKEDAEVCYGRGHEGHRKSARDTYDTVADTVGLVPSVRMKDNVIQGITVVVITEIAALVGFVMNGGGPGHRHLLGLLGSLLVSGAVLMVVGWVRARSRSSRSQAALMNETRALAHTNLIARNWLRARDLLRDRLRVLARAAERHFAARDSRREPELQAPSSTASSATSWARAGRPTLEIFTYSKAGRRSASVRQPAGLPHRIPGGSSQKREMRSSPTAEVLSATIVT